MKKLLIFSLLLAKITIAFSQIPNYIPKDSLIGWWPFNSNVKDQSGKGNDAVNYGATLTKDRFGNDSNAYFFDGNDYMKVNQYSNFNFDTTSFSIACWATKEGTSSFQHLISRCEQKNWPHKKSFTLRYQFSGIAGFLSGEGNSNNGSVDYSNSNLKLNEWNHIAITFENIGNTLTLYINGKVANQVIVSNQNSYSNNGNLFFGVEEPTVSLPSGPLYLKGSMDDIGIWNRALDSSEIKSVFNSQESPFQNCTYNLKDSFTMNFTSKFTRSVVTTTKGKAYIVEVKGKYGVANSTVHRDAAYNLTQGGASVHPTAPIASSCDACWKMNNQFGTRPTPDTFSKSNTYNYILTGDGNKIEFSFEDNLYSDNAGSLDFKVFEKSCCLLDSNFKINDIASAKDSSVEFKVKKSTIVDYSWETKVAGMDFIEIRNNSSYTGQKTEKLALTKVGIQNHNQLFKLVISNSECKDSTIATLKILDTCLNTINDTTYTTIYDTTVINIFDTIYNTIYDTVVINRYDTIAVQDTLIINAKLTGTTPLQTNLIKVYPNPAKDYLVLDFGNYISMSGYEVIILDATGKSVYSSTVNKQLEAIDINTWSGKGIYFIRIFDKQGNRIENKKIIIQ